MNTLNARKKQAIHPDPEGKIEEKLILRTFPHSVIPFLLWGCMTFWNSFNQKISYISDTNVLQQQCWQMFFFFSNYFQLFFPPPVIIKQIIKCLKKMKKSKCIHENCCKGFQETNKPKKKQQVQLLWFEPLRMTTTWLRTSNNKC